MTPDAATIRRQLQFIEGRLAALHEATRELEGKRDHLRLMLLDHEGLSDRQPIGAR